MDEKNIIEFECGFEDWIQGYRRYINTASKKRRIADCIIFGILTLLFLQQVIIQPSYGVGWICLAISVFTLAMSLTTPARLIGSAKRAYEDKEKKLKFCLEICEDAYYVSVDGDESSLKTSLLRKDLKAEENETHFWLYSKDGFLYIPKSAISEEETKAVKELIEKIRNK